MRNVRWKVASWLLTVFLKIYLLIYFYSCSSSDPDEYIFQIQKLFYCLLRNHNNHLLPSSLTKPFQDM